LSAAPPGIKIAIGIAIETRKDSSAGLGHSANRIDSEKI